MTTNAAANAKPIQRPGVVRYLPGVSWTSESIATPRCGWNAKAVSPAPNRRSFNIDAKCEVSNAIFSRTPIARNGNTAQRNVARRAHPEISSAQP